MAPSIDMLSMLPDSLLSTIVSLLPFKEAVRTSLLSKSWSDISKATTNIEFNELFFVKSDQPIETREAQRRDFLDFMTFWMDNHPETIIDKLSLRLTNLENAVDVVERCIAFSTLYKAKELEIDFSHPSWDNDRFFYDIHDAFFELPIYFYGNNNNLKYLKLYSCGFESDLLLNFCSLREVSLGWMKVSIDDVKALLSNCEMLESLSMKRCWSLNNFDLGEEKLRITKLVLDKCHFGFDVFKVNAPHLRFFHYAGVMTFFAIELRALAIEEAILDFSLEYGFEGHGLFLYTLLDDLYTAKVLTLCSYSLQVIPSGPFALSMQRGMNVRHLILKASLHMDEFVGIAFMLNSCPKLECLTIELGYPKALFGYETPPGFDHKRFWIEEHARRYICLESSLKEVEIKGFRGSKNEVRVLIYLIMCGEVLKKINIHVLKGDIRCDHAMIVEDFRRDVARIMLAVPRASEELEISVY